MLDWHPLFRCRACGKRLYEGEGIEVRGCKNPKYFHLTLCCTNPRCKAFKRKVEADVPYISRGGSGRHAQRCGV